MPAKSVHAHTYTRCIHRPDSLQAEADAWRPVPSRAAAPLAARAVGPQAPSPGGPGLAAACSRLSVAPSRAVGGRLVAGAAEGTSKDWRLRAAESRSNSKPSAWRRSCLCRDSCLALNLRLSVTLAYTYILTYIYTHARNTCRDSCLVLNLEAEAVYTQTHT